MSDPIVFESTSPRMGLPFLFAGQAQKETFVNEALVRIDSLLHGVIEAEQNAPPTAPADGSAWLIGTSPTGAWVDHAGMIAICQAGQWLLVEPCNGMRLLDLATSGDIRRIGDAWVRPVAPALPTGGAVVDSQARTALDALVTALRSAGILAD